MKTKEIKRYNLPNERIVLSRIDAKPYELIVLIILVGVFVTYRSQWLYGGFFALLSIIILIVLPSCLLIEFTKDYLIIYNKGNSADCYIVYYEDIVTWRYMGGFKEDELVINLVDGSSLKLEAFSKILFEREMNKFLKEKKEKK